MLFSFSLFVISFRFSSFPPLFSFSLLPFSFFLFLVPCLSFSSPFYCFLSIPTYYSFALCSPHSLLSISFFLLIFLPALPALVCPSSLYILLITLLITARIFHSLSLYFFTLHVLIFFSLSLFFSSVIPLHLFLSPHLPFCHSCVSVCSSALPS